MKDFGKVILAFFCSLFPTFLILKLIQQLITVGPWLSILLILGSIYFFSFIFLFKVFKITEDLTQTEAMAITQKFVGFLNSGVVRPRDLVIKADEFLDEEFNSYYADRSINPAQSKAIIRLATYIYQKNKDPLFELPINPYEEFEKVFLPDRTKPNLELMKVEKGMRKEQIASDLEKLLKSQGIKIVEGKKKE